MSGFMHTIVGYSLVLYIQLEVPLVVIHLMDYQLEYTVCELYLVEVGLAVEDRNQIFITSLQSELTFIVFVVKGVERNMDI